MTLFTRKETTFLTLILIFSFIPTFGGLFRVVELVGGPMIAPINPRAVIDPMPIVLHVLGSFVFCLLGALQFLHRFRGRGRKWHRIAGRVVAVAGLVSAVTGLWMTVAFVFPLALQGPLLYLVRVIVSIAMIGLILHAIGAVRAGRIEAHRAAMIRAYAIAQGASTQTVMGLTVMLVTGQDLIGFERDVMMVSAWAINLILAEMIIPGTLRRGGRASHRPV
ncbi:putative membrane protein [Rubricella aquisinus]|uniref:Putative membrane protein n=1 Tax=Rubricella aquisinus TaxID=2028108 RepID=A0A840X6Y5_9RHOB|nr:DUF2306 domain-containing protein [Rubricella aquisinus]MBB5516467.1 putative membrane protein [Rubricella aquisinus]